VRGNFKLVTNNAIMCLDLVHCADHNLGCGYPIKRVNRCWKDKK